MTRVRKYFTEEERAAAKKRTAKANYEKNKEVRKLKAREYYEKNKQKKKDQMNDYYHRNKGPTRSYIQRDITDFFNNEK